MMTAIQQRCWNHETREAVCRCPECGRSFCRECVTEHEARLLCAACLAKITEAQSARRGGLRRLAPAGMLAAAIVAAWIFFFALGQTAMTLVERAERTSWQQ
jgi:hypothetical protein